MNKEVAPPQNYEKGLHWLEVREKGIRLIAYFISLHSPTLDPKTHWFEAEKKWEEEQKLPSEVFIGS